jgi:Flp pilus assembly protein TadG
MGLKRSTKKSSVSDRLRQERGAILVHASVALAALVGFSALTIDLGVLWAARTQAQNAADAAAHAAATALAYGDPLDTDAAIESGRSVLADHKVWNEPANSSADVNVVPCPAGTPATGRCVQTAVYRDTEHNTPLPAYFSRMFGFSASSVRATTTVRVLPGNATTCLRPWAVADSWIDNTDTTPPVDTIWTPDDLFEPGGGPPSADHYERPSLSGPGTGYAHASMAGTAMHLTLASSLGGYPPAVPGNVAFDLELSRADTNPGGDVQFAMNIASCSGVAVKIGDSVTVAQHDPVAVTVPAVEALIASDPAAAWDGSAIVGSAFSISPRLVAIALFDPSLYPTGVTDPTFPVVVSNLLGLFIESVTGSVINGYIVPMGGVFNSSAPQVTEESAFLRTITFIR